MNMKKIKKWAVNRGGFVAFLVAPFAIISIFRFYGEEWLGRIIAISISLTIGTSYLLWNSLNPRAEMIRKGSKLDRLGREKTKKIVGRLTRIFALSLALCVTYLFIQFTQDIGLIIKGEAPVLVRGKVVANSSGTSWAGLLYCRITIDTGNNKEKYSLFYPVQSGIKEKEVYQLKVLPVSKFILEANRIK